LTQLSDAMLAAYCVMDECNDNSKQLHHIHRNSWGSTLSSSVQSRALGI